MPVPPALRLPLLLSLPGIAGSAAAADQAALPTGDSAAFRQQTAAWQAPPPAPPVTAPRPRAEPASLPRRSSGYGLRTDPIHGRRRMHNGLDIPGGAGTPILASATGTIAFAGVAGGYGRMVEIDHGGGLTTRYAHLARLLVHRGDVVARQQPIALMGSTGRSTGTHLHFEVRLDGRATDPLDWFGASAPAAPRAIAVQAPSAPHVSQFASRRAPARPAADRPKPAALPGGEAVR